MDASIDDVNDVSMLVEINNGLQSKIVELEGMIFSLQNAKDRIERMVENAAVMIVVFDISGNILLINEAAQRITGYRRDEILGRNWFEIVVPRKLYPYVWDEFQRWQLGALKSDRHFSSPIITKSGETRCVSWRSNYLHEQGCDKQIISFGIDITGRRYAISERRSAEERLRESEERFRTFVQNFQGIAFRSALDLSPIFLHGAVAAITGYTESEFLAGKLRWDIVVHRDDLPEYLESRKRLASISGYSTELDYRIIYKGGAVRHIHELSQNICDDSGNPVFIQGAIYDTTSQKLAEETLKSSLYEKELLLKEIHHRVKNNLQVISSLLSIQLRNLSDGGSDAALRECQNRIRSMALVYDKLYRSENLARVNLADYIRSLMLVLSGSFDIGQDRTGIDLDLEDVLLGIDDAIPCGLIINELVTNCFKHAFPGHLSKSRRIYIGLGSSGSRVTLTIGDNGIGLPEDSVIKEKSSMGMMLVTTLVKQLKGTLEISRGSGSRFRIVFDC